MKSFKLLLATPVFLSSPEMIGAMKLSIRQIQEDKVGTIHRLQSDLDATGEYSSNGDRNLRLANGDNIFSIENKDSNMKTGRQYREMDRKGTNVFYHEGMYASISV